MRRVWTCTPSPRAAVCPFLPGREPAIDTAHYFSLWDAARHAVEQLLEHPVKLEIEPGRYLMAESGVLVTEVRATKQQGANHFVMVDAGFSDLVRPPYTAPTTAWS